MCVQPVMMGARLHMHLAFVHLPQFESKLIGNETLASLHLKGRRCSPCRSPLAVPLNLCPSLFAPRVAARGSPPHRRRSGSRSADGDSNSPDHGTQCSTRLSDVSPCPESRLLVAAHRQSVAAQALSCGVHPVGRRRLWPE